MAAARSKYVEEAVAAARSVILELHRVLGQYREHFVLIGGWVPELLYPGQHVGSMDVDLALDRVALAQPDYETIEKLLLEAGYCRGTQKYQYVRVVGAGNREIDVHVDLLAGQYSGTGKGHRHQRVQDVLARKVRGGDLAFELHKLVSLRGELPRGGMFTVDVRVAAEVPLIVMKSLALDERDNPKDAYDICYCLARFPGGPTALAEEFRPHLERPVVEEALRKLAKNFASVNEVGPVSAATFDDDIEDEEERQIVTRAAFDVVDRLVRALGIER